MEAKQSVEGSGAQPVGASTSNSTSTTTLRDRLAAVLPKGHRFGVYHLSTPPRRVEALCSAPPNERPDRTYCENHFLAISINAPPSATTTTPSTTTTTTSAAEPQQQQRPVLILGLEVFIYTTAHSTTLFVSKADSTGHLGLLGLPRGAPSPIREACAAFLAHLVAHRRRDGVQLVVSLFARAQAQYLFPGSVDCPGKHVLDDRGLVRWWCRVLDPLLRSPSPSSSATTSSVAATATAAAARGYLLVPGLDDYETRAFIPRASAGLWSLGHALERISHYHGEFDWLPPRCLIPRFPDDPKSRFRDELDEEAARTGAMRTTGTWKSVKTLDTFWEMMAFRQECSSGRLTGFIWVVFDDESNGETAASAGASSTGAHVGAAPETPKKQRTTSIVTPTTTPRKLFPSKADQNSANSPTKLKPKSDPTATATSSSSTPPLGNDTNQTQTPSTKLKPKSSKPPKGRGKNQKKKRTLRGPIVPRQPKVKTALRNYLLDRPASTPYYLWSPAGRGERIVDDADYKRIVELLLHLDFATLDKAAGSTRRWVSEVAGAMGPWGYDVVGARDLPLGPSGAASAAGAQRVNNLTGLVKRKRSDTSGTASVAK